MSVIAGKILNCNYGRSNRSPCLFVFVIMSEHVRQVCAPLSGSPPEAPDGDVHPVPVFGDRAPGYMNSFLI